MPVIKNFDLDTECRRAWPIAWKELCEPTVYEYDDGEKRTFEPRQSWLTATDIERRIRAHFAEQADGLEEGKRGLDDFCMKGTVTISTGSRYSLMDCVRDWLADEVRAGRLTRHNFGRGHISGMRYRPVGMELTDAEKKTLEKADKRAKGETPVHFSNSTSWLRKPLCVADRNVKRAGYRQPKRSSARIVSEPAKVTCQRCLKRLAEGAADLVQSSIDSDNE
jgi:hypothetical protein